MKTLDSVIIICIFYTIFSFGLAHATEQVNCVGCHEKLTPGQVADWQSSKMSQEEGITCSDCHGDTHISDKEYPLYILW